MKRVLIAVAALVMCLVGKAWADDVSIIDTLHKIPGMKQGIGFSLVDSKVNYLTTTDIALWKGLSLEGGYNSKGKVVAVVSADLLNLKKLGVTVPILDLIDLRVGLYGGYGNINIEKVSKAEWDAGISATAITVKF